MKETKCHQSINQRAFTVSPVHLHFLPISRSLMSHRGETHSPASYVRVHMLDWVGRLAATSVFLPNLPLLIVLS